MSHKKFGPDRFSCFDVYWIQTNKQTDKQTDTQAKFIYRLIKKVFFTGDCMFSVRHATNGGSLKTMFTTPLMGT